MSFVAALAATIGEGALALGVGAATAGVIGGVGAGALTGAALGAGTSALMGGDPGKGAEMGALSGGVTFGLGGLGSGAADAATGLTSSNLSAINSAIPTVGDMGSVAADTGLNTTSQAAISAAAQDAGLSTANQAAINSAIPTMGNTAADTGLNATGQMATGGIRALTPQPATFMQKMAEAPTQIGNFVNNNTLGTLGATTLGAGALMGGFAPTTPNTPKLSQPTSPFHWAGGTPNYDANNYTPAIPNPASYAYTPSYAEGGGITALGGYSDGGQLLKGPGDGVSDDIPAVIGNQPARLAEGEFVIPARIVSEIGNGSTDAGAKRLYAMMDRINADRTQTTRQGKFSEDTKAYRHLI